MDSDEIERLMKLMISESDSAFDKEIYDALATGTGAFRTTGEGLSEAVPSAHMLREEDEDDAPSVRLGRFYGTGITPIKNRDLADMKLYTAYTGWTNPGEGSPRFRAFLDCGVEFTCALQKTGDDPNTIYYRNDGMYHGDGHAAVFAMVEPLVEDASLWIGPDFEKFDRVMTTITVHPYDSTKGAKR